MKRLTLLAALLLVMVPQAFAGSTWHKSIAAAQKEAKAKKKLILVDMFAEWCGWCHRFEREVFPSETFQKATDDMVLLRLDTEDNGEGTKLARQFGVTSLPTFLILKSDMSLAGQIQGYFPAGEFAKRLGDARRKNDEFERDVRNEKSFGTDYAKRLDLARELTRRMAYKESEPRLQKLVNEKKAPKEVLDQAWYELALTQALQKKYDAALKTANLAVTRAQGEPQERSKYLIGQIYFEQGNFAAAAKEFRSFKTTFPNSALTRNVDRALASVEQQIRVRR